MAKYRNASNAPIFLRGGIRVGPLCEVELDERTAMSAGPMLIKVGTSGPQLLTEAPIGPLEVVRVDEAPKAKEEVLEVVENTETPQLSKKAKKKARKALEALSEPD